MKLDCNENSDGKGKYALIKLRGFDIDELLGCAVKGCGRHRYDHEKWSGDERGRRDPQPDHEYKPPRKLSIPFDRVDFGYDPDRFFVIRLKDKYAPPGLRAYAQAAERDDPEWAAEIRTLAEDAVNQWNKKRPD